MARSLASGVSSALSSSGFKVGIFVEMEFAAGTQRYCNLARNTTWNSQTYTAGKIMNISSLETTLDYEGTEAYITFSLTQSEFNTIVTSKTPLHVPVTIRLVPVNGNTDVLSSTTGSVILYYGRVTKLDSLSTSEGNFITFNMSSALSLIFSPYRLRYNQYEQQNVLGYTTDVGLRGVGIYNTDKSSEIASLDQQTSDFFSTGFVPAPIDP